MIRWATIVAKSPQWVELKLVKQTPCQGCTGQCHRPLFKLFSIQDDNFRIYQHQTGLQLSNSHLLFDEDPAARQVGQQVGLQIDDGDMLAGGFQFYVWPLLMIILSMAVGHYFAVVTEQSPDLWAFIGMLLALTWVFFRYRIKHQSTTSKLPKVTVL
ncbi:MAG: hypothetical protein DWP95_10715 [Proteobacteria bacterium]|nr:MAG: hypothetical protein DWP95_10715 [Pseudomonadota bacterium]